MKEINHSLVRSIICLLHLLALLWLVYWPTLYACSQARGRVESLCSIFQLVKVIVQFPHDVIELWPTIRLINCEGPVECRNLPFSLSSMAWYSFLWFPLRWSRRPDVEKLIRIFPPREIDFWQRLHFAEASLLQSTVKYSQTRLRPILIIGMFLHKKNQRIW